jgi:hypothetical protein
MIGEIDNVFGGFIMSYSYRNDHTGIEITLDETSEADVYLVSRIFHHKPAGENSIDAFPRLADAYANFSLLVQAELVAETTRLQQS